jgi:hypothetical protein
MERYEESKNPVNQKKPPAPVNQKKPPAPKKSDGGMMGQSYEICNDQNQNKRLLKD